MLDNMGQLSWRNETVVYLSCNVEHVLQQLSGKVSIFREPDLGNELTAIAVLESPKNRRVLKKLKLLQNKGA
jgi:hypothetical protein